MYSVQEVRSPSYIDRLILKSLKTQHTKQKISPNATEQHDSLATLCASQMVSFPILIGSKAEGDTNVWDEKHCLKELHKTFILFHLPPPKRNN